MTCEDGKRLPQRIDVFLVTWQYYSVHHRFRYLRQTRNFGCAHSTDRRLRSTQALHAQRVLRRLVVRELRLRILLGRIELGRFHLVGHVPYRPDKPDRKAEACQNMDGHGIDDVDALRDGEVVKVAIRILDVLGRHVGIRR